MIGRTLGAYQVVVKLGEGGMGEVYRATDTNLKRQVAIKVLPASVAGDDDRLARFQREAEILAALNHPNIAAIYGLEKTADLTALVMELVEGQDLSELIGAAKATPYTNLPLSDSLAIARQIADALEAAHEQGIVHRDLKPQNIKVRADGTVKVLDFGLAKAMETNGASTMTSPAMTQMGMILGTAAYMSPEQAKGRAVDKRADIWAFGVVLYEMLTGRQLFAGDSVAETIGFVATREPDWTALPASTPASIRRLLTRCLTRDPKHRLRDIGEARIALVDPADDAHATAPAPTTSFSRTGPLTIGLALAAVVMTAVAGYLALRPSPQPAPIRLEMVDVPAGGPAPSMPVVSPDGKTVAFAKGPGAASMIWLRPLAAKTAYPLAGTEGALQPFWSPDGSEVGFTFQGDLPTARRQIRKVPVGGGNVQTLGEVPYALQGTWNQDGVIVVSQAGGTTAEGGLLRLPATGGTPTRINDARTWRWPSFLPDGRQFLFTVVSRDENEAGIYLGALDSTDVTRLTSVVSSAQYADGHVFYVKDQTVVAQPLDLTARRLTGDPVSLFEDVHFTPPIYLGAFSVAGTTLVARASMGPPLRQLTWMNRSGAITGTLGEPGPFSAPDLSPDGRLVALIRANDAGGPSSLWTVDLERGVFSESRAGTASVRFSARGDRIAYVGLDGIRAARTGGGEEIVLLDTGAVRSGAANFPGSVSDWSPDDRYVSAQVLNVPQILDVTAPGRPMLIGSRLDVAFSPAGGWMAYQGVVTGSQRSPVFVEPFTGKPPSGAGRIQVSQGGGQRPRWRQDGRELFFISGGEMMAVTVTPGSPLRLGTPRRLFTVPAGATYDVSADGEQFLLPVPVAEVARPPFSVLLNWRALLAAPTSRR